MRPPRDDQLRLLAKVARMYHERGLRQPQIAHELNISQPRVSRLLRQAVELGVVRTTVALPPGVYTEIEEQLQARYGLRDAVVVDVGGTSGLVLPALGAAAAAYLDATLIGGDVIGVSSWSASLLAAVDVMQPTSGRVARQVVQLLGGIGDPDVQVEATRLTGRLSERTGASPLFMPAPGLVSTVALRRALVKDASVVEVMTAWASVTVALVGIGSLEASQLLKRSGNAIGDVEESKLRRLGAVGDICLRYFDEAGVPVRSDLDQRVVGISASQLSGIGRRVSVAGGARKYTAIRAALRGRWVNVLITDLDTATRLVAEPSP